ncbi:MAG: L-threonylcarbamoyladenylate synthase [Parcubacteria group bacterium]|jgi:L-threonylcarbamoyladenylate synthase
MIKNIINISKLIRCNGIGVIPTDTIYGVAASALSKKTVSRAYKILKRNPKKPFIILIGSIKDLAIFGVKIDKSTENILKKLWPGKVSVILPIKAKKFEYLHREAKTLAFRLPKKKTLISLLKKTGPLISTSANPQGKKPAQSILEAKKYFGDQIDFYIRGGKMISLPSTLVEIKRGQVNVLRKGATENI